MDPGAETFTVLYGFERETFSMWGFSSPPSLVGPPIGVIDTPAEMSSVAGEVAFTGWAIDNSGILGVDIYRSSVVGEAGYPTARVNRD